MKGTEHAEAKTPPPLAMMRLLFGKQVSYALSGLARLGIADHMEGTPRPVEEIAAKAKAHAPSLYRVMRMLAGFGVFQRGSAAPIRADADGRAAEERCAGLDALHRNDVRRGVLNPRL